MRKIERCLVCGENGFDTLFPASFEGSWQEAVPFFLTGRQGSVTGTTVRCRSCGFVFLNPQFEADEYRKIYQNLPREAHAAKDSRRRYLQQRELVLEHVSGGRHLDLGCGDGSFMQLLGDGFDSTGIEPGSPDADELRDGPGPIVHGDALEVLRNQEAEWKECFDVVTAWESFEHLPLLRETLEAARGVLKPGGLLICTLPNVASPVARLAGRRWNLYLLEHLWYFSPETFRRFAEGLGFECGAASGVLYPVDLGTILRRMQQSYGLDLRRFTPSPWKRWNLPLPIGLMACVLSRPRAS